MTAHIGKQPGGEPVPAPDEQHPQAVPTLSAAKDSKAATLRRDKRGRWLARVQAVFAVITASITAGILVVTYRYTGHAKQQVDLMRESVTLTREAFQNDQRAWVSVPAGLLLGELEVGKQFIAAIVVVNSGHTPARRARTKIVASLGVTPPADPGPPRPLQGL